MNTDGRYGWGMKRQMEPAEVFFEGEDKTFMEVIFFTNCDRSK